MTDPSPPVPRIVVVTTKPPHRRGTHNGGPESGGPPTVGVEDLVGDEGSRSLVGALVGDPAHPSEGMHGGETQ
jgi:hypothetical protein